MRLAGIRSSESSHLFQALDLLKNSANSCEGCLSEAAWEATCRAIRRSWLEKDWFLEDVYFSPNPHSAFFGHCELRIPDCEFALSQESARNFGSRICSLSIQGIPMMLIALNKARCCFGSPSACSIIWKISRWIIIPSRKNRRGSLPCRFDHVGSMKQTRVPHHAIVEQFFVTCRRRPVPELVVTKVQLYRPGTNCWSRNFCAYLECDTLFRLDSKDEIIRSDGIRFI